MFLEQQICTSKCFLKHHVTLKTGVMMLKGFYGMLDQINAVLVSIRNKKKTNNSDPKLFNVSV